MAPSVGASLSILIIIIIKVHLRYSFDFKWQQEYWQANHRTDVLVLCTTSLNYVVAVPPLACAVVHSILLVYCTQTNPTCDFFQNIKR